MGKAQVCEALHLCVGDGWHTGISSEQMDIIHSVESGLLHTKERTAHFGKLSHSHTLRVVHNISEFKYNFPCGLRSIITTLEFP